MAGAQLFVEREVILERHRDPLEVPPHQGLQVLRQARHEGVVVTVDQAVLVAHREGIGDAHADIALGADHRVRRLADPREPAGYPAVQVLHCGDPDSIISNDEWRVSR
jgi:hypothetical protein